MITPDSLATSTQAKPRKVAVEHIERMVDSLTFKFARVGGTTVTGCWAFLPNDFQVGYGESACVDPNEYNQADGEKYARERCLQNARNELWKLEGYMLKVTGQVSAAFMPAPPSTFVPVGFTTYIGLPTTRYAYQVQESDVVTYVKENTAEVTVAGQPVPFKHYEEVKPGDYVVFLKAHDIYHCSQQVFCERNVT